MLSCIQQPLYSHKYWQESKQGNLADVHETIWLLNHTVKWETALPIDLNEQWTSACHRASALIHTHTCLHNVTQKHLSTVLVAVQRAIQGKLSSCFSSLICGEKWHIIYLLLAVMEVLTKWVAELSDGVLSPQLSPLWIWILPMFGEPEANSLILGCCEAQWDGWLFNSSACSHKDMFDFHPYRDVWFLILNKKDLLWVNVSLSQREATDSQSLLLSPLRILPLGLCLRLEIGVPGVFRQL